MFVAFFLTNIYLYIYLEDGWPYYPTLDFQSNIMQPRTRLVTRIAYNEDDKNLHCKVWKLNVVFFERGTIKIPFRKIPFAQN